MVRYYRYFYIFSLLAFQSVTLLHVFYVAGVFPLFRRSAADLQGASLRVHITFVTSSVPVKNLAGQMDSDNQEELSLDQSDEADQVPLPSSKSSRTFPDIAAVQHTEMDLDESFPASVVVDQALHLSLKGLSKYFSLYSVDIDVFFMHPCQAVL